MATTSSKIKKNISSITFDGKYTIIGFHEGFQPNGHNTPVKEEKTYRTDMARHGDFDRAMEKFKAHWLLRSMPFMDFKDSFGKQIDKDWFDKFLFENDPRFSEIEVSKVIITTKKDITGFQIAASISSVDDQVTSFKCPPFSTIKTDGGYNYPLIDLITTHLETLLTEAEEFLNYKSANGQLRIAV
jgi:hypothetical protein